MNAEADRTFESHDELVQVFGTKEESEAMVVRGLLESNGIEAIITALDAPQDVLPGVGGMVVRVSPEDAEQARQIIADFRNDNPEDDESETTDDSAA